MSRLDHENMESDSEESDINVHPSFNTYIPLLLEKAMYETLTKKMRNIVCGVRLKACKTSTGSPQMSCCFSHPGKTKWVEPTRGPNILLLNVKYTIEKIEDRDKQMSKVVRMQQF